MSTENANAVLTVCAEQVITRLFDAIGREFGYLFYYKTNIKNFKNKVVQLKNLKDDVEFFLNEQSRNNAERAKSSIGWLKEVEDLNSTVKAVEDKDKSRVWCVNLRNNRYRQSKKSTNLVAEIQKLLDKAPKIDAIHQALPAAMLPGASANDAAKDFLSRTDIMDNVMKALKDDKINVIGICGLGGIGKTTILHEVRERARAQKLFDAVAMTTVSQVINVFEIQKNLASMLGLKKIEEVNDIIPRADLLQRRLTNGTNLIILDDIWSEIKLKEVGIPVGNGMARCKVVLASRFETVCASMRTQKTIPVNVLSKDEAWLMFKKVAGECIERWKLEKIAKEIADKCGGLPIALVTIAGALSNKKKSSWEDARRQLRQNSATRISGMKELYFPIMVSYKLLATHDLEEAQPLLLICCQHGEDDEIEVEKLARYCLALELFKGVDKLVEARNRTYKLIEDLKSYFLLQAVAGDEEGMCEKVIMHDVVREVCLSTVFEAKDERDKVYMHIMSQDLGGGHELDTNNEVDYPKLKLLTVPDYYDGGLNDIRRMEELRVLEIGESETNLDLPLALQVLKKLRMLCIEDQLSLSEDIMAAIGSLSRLEILRFWGSKISSFPQQIRQLSSLKLLDLRSFEGENECEEDLVPSGILPQLNKLEVLCMGNYHLLGTGVDKNIENVESYGRITELDSLHDLTTLQIDLLDHNDLLDLQCFCFEKLETFLFTTRGYRFYQVSLQLVWKCIQFKDVVGMEWVKEAKIEFIVRSTLTLRLEDNDYWTDPLILKEFVSLEKLELEECNQLEYIIPKRSLDKLLILKLNNMSNLRRLWMGPIDPLCLVNLREITIYECSALETIFPPTTTKCLTHLQILTIRWCLKLEGIFSKGELGASSISTAEIIKEPLNDFTLQFPKLRILNLENLGELQGFYNVNIDDGKVIRPLINPQVIMLPGLETCYFSCLHKIKQIVGGGVLELPKLVACNWLQNLQEVKVTFCDSLETLFDFEGLHFMGENAQLLTLSALKYIKLLMLPKLEHLFWQIPNGFLSFQNLETLEVDECESLGYLISSSLAHMLVNLKSLVVENCKSMKEVIKMDEDSDVKKIPFGFLSSVRLKHLENLLSFCSDDRQSIEFPSLEEVIIYKCPGMKTFCCGQLTAEKLQGVNINENTYDEDILVWKGDLNETVRHLNERNMVNEMSSDTEEGDDDSERCNNEGTPMKASIPPSIVTSPSASLTSNAVTDNNESISNSLSPDLRKDALPPFIEFVPSASTEQSSHTSNDSMVQPKADKALSDMSSLRQGDIGSSSSIPLERGMLKKAFMPLSIVASPNASVTSDIVSPPPVSDNNEDLVNSSSSPDLRKVALSPVIEFVPPASMEQSVHSSDSLVQPKADHKELIDMSFSIPDDDWKKSMNLIEGFYVKAKLKTTFEEILAANPNFLSGLRLKTAKMKSDVIESTICSLQILRQHTALTISSEELAYIKDSLDDMETSGLDTAWLKRGYQRAILATKEKKVVSAAEELAMLEREETEDEAVFEMARVKLQASKARRVAFKAEYDALLQELESGKELFGRGFELETSLGDGLLD